MASFLFQWYEYYEDIDETHVFYDVFEGCLDWKDAVNKFEESYMVNISKCSIYEIPELPVKERTVE